MRITKEAHEQLLKLKKKQKRASTVPNDDAPDNDDDLDSDEADPRPPVRTTKKAPAQKQGKAVKQLDQDEEYSGDESTEYGTRRPLVLHQAGEVDPEGSESAAEGDSEGESDGEGDEEED